MKRGAAAEREARALRELAEMHGIQTSYVDLSRRRRVASGDALLSLLSALGAGAGRMADVPGALRARRAADEGRLCEPVCVFWGGRGSIEFSAPKKRRGFRASAAADLPDAPGRGWKLDAAPARMPGKFCARVPEKLPFGYHPMSVAAGGRGGQTLVISAPKRAHELGARGERLWGVFLPLYALRAARSAGVADLTDLAALVDWTGALGGQIVATLPLLAAFLEEPFQPSPYSPASRLFWNELYVDPAATEEFAHASAARALLESPKYRTEAEAVARERHLDYRRAYALKRRALEPLAEAFFSRDSDRRRTLEAEADRGGEIGTYARFRGAMKAQGRTWPLWPERMKAGEIGAAECDERERKFHLYAQLAAREQMDRLAKKSAERGAGLYLDYPLGVNPDGYDAWREQKSFVEGVSAGAPPDPFFTRGQDWGFAPLHPERIREDGYRYPIACFRNHLKAAGLLRVDHVMGLHRLFCIPRGIPAREGLYLRYRAEEFYAILALESAPAQAAIVGEDLGTVPAEVRRLMKRHGIDRMSVAQFEFAPSAARAMPKLPRECLAAVNTHDMYPFAAFWKGLDLADRVDMKLMTEAEAAAEGSARERLRSALGRFLHAGGAGAESASALKAIHARLAASPARTVIVNLEDLWGETRPQNTPGTLSDRNWTRRATPGFEEFSGSPQVRAELGEIDRLRRAKAKK